MSTQIATLNNKGTWVTSGWWRTSIGFMFFCAVGASPTLASETAGTTAPALDDTDVTLAVENQLASDPGVSSRLIDVDTNDAVVTLIGAVPNLLAKERTTAIAQAVKGVRSVVKRIVVTPIARTDAQIHNDVMLALAQDSVADTCELNVHAKVKGVVDINNYLAVREACTWKSDHAAKEDIQDELFWSPFVNADQVAVTVKNGVATLTGTVASLRALGAAIENAREGGAVRVDSNLQMRGLPPLSPLAAGGPMQVP
ncbi:MAG: BON domain-containing protein [Candidatus Binatia bacterium]